MTVRIGLGDAHDPRVRDAVARVLAHGGVTPVLVGGERERVPGGAQWVPVPAGVDPTVRLAELVAAGELAAGAGGSLSPSATVIRAALRHLRRDGALVSAAFALRHREGWATYADCVVTPEPNATQLAQIALDAADHHARMFAVVPRVAMLSFSTAASATHPRVSLVREATALVRERRRDLAVDGEVQFDVAVDPQVAARKIPGSAVAGAANVFVFPSLESGNIAYKVAERVGGVRALGSFVLGLRRPWVDFSRGCSADDIADTVLALAAAERAARAQVDSSVA